MTSPKVSIGLPVYNGENYLSQAIESLLGQTFSDLELIISDNASTDGTETIAREYAARDGRVRYVRQPVNRGAGWNFSETFRLARGEYFKWAAHDDLCAPSFVERCVERLDLDRELVLCFSRAGVIDQAGSDVEEELTDDPNRCNFQGVSAAGEAARIKLCGSARPHDRYLGVLLYSQRCYEVFGVVRGSAMRRTGLHRPYNGGEKVFLAELSLLGRFAEIDETLFYSRWHDERFSSNPSAVAQAVHMNPAAPRRFAWPRQVRSSWGYLSVVGSTPLALAERCLCMAMFGRYLLQVGKWGRALREAATGSATTVRLPGARSAANKRKIVNGHLLTTEA
ncbi:MAG TPA: glycosyltransferase family 2 protein [Pirellulales bacterium]|nr:glycosyltransferase family 2 protein [Pirellulales bacterium]